MSGGSVQVSIFVDGKLVNVVMVEADGTWRADTAAKMMARLIFIFSITDAAGNTEVSKDYSVDVDHQPTSQRSTLKMQQNWFT